MLAPRFGSNYQQSLADIEQTKALAGQKSFIHYLQGLLHTRGN